MTFVNQDQSICKRVCQVSDFEQPKWCIQKSINLSSKEFILNAYTNKQTVINGIFSFKTTNGETNSHSPETSTYDDDAFVRVFCKISLFDFSGYFSPRF